MNSIKVLCAIRRRIRHSSTRRELIDVGTKRRSQLMVLNIVYLRRLLNVIHKSVNQEFRRRTHTARDKIRGLVF